MPDINVPSGSSIRVTAANVDDQVIGFINETRFLRVNFDESQTVEIGPLLRTGRNTFILILFNGGAEDNPAGARVRVDINGNSVPELSDNYATHLAPKGFVNAWTATFVVP